MLLSTPNDFTQVWNWNIAHELVTIYVKDFPQLGID